MILVTLRAVTQAVLLDQCILQAQSHQPHQSINQHTVAIACRTPEHARCVRDYAPPLVPVNNACNNTRQSVDSTAQKQHHVRATYPLGQLCGACLVKPALSHSTARMSSAATATATATAQRLSHSLRRLLLSASAVRRLAVLDVCTAQHNHNSLSAEAHKCKAITIAAQ